MLLLPSANRVYAGASTELARAELAVFSEAVLGGAVSDAEVTRRAGVPYLEFTVEPLTAPATAFQEGDMATTAGLSPKPVSADPGQSAAG